MASTNRFEVLADEDDTPSPVTEHDDPGESAQDLAAHVVHMQTAALKVVTPSPVLVHQREAAARQLQQCLGLVSQEDLLKMIGSAGSSGLGVQHNDVKKGCFSTLRAASNLKKDDGDCRRERRDRRRGETVVQPASTITGAPFGDGLAGEGTGLRDTVKDAACGGKLVHCAVAVVRAGRRRRRSERERGTRRRAPNLAG